MREVGRDQSVTIPADSLHEPSFHTVFSSGQRQVVLSGNKEFSTGDRLKRPEGGGGGGSGSGSGQGSGDGEDGFRFVLTRDEFLDLFFEDLELPDLVKSQIVATETMSPMRAGISMDGSPSQIDMGRTMRQSMARRIGLRRPKPPEVRELEAEIVALERSADDADRLRTLRLELEHALRRLARVPWIDPVDLRYRRYTMVPKPSARAVMFCLMDVSGSMSEQMKDIAKRFFLLLHVFPGAALQARRGRVHPPYRNRGRMRRADLLHRSAHRRHGGLHGARGVHPYSARALPAGVVEHLRCPGVGRRQLRQRHPTRRLAA